MQVGRKNQSDKVLDLDLDLDFDRDRADHTLNLSCPFSLATPEKRLEVPGAVKPKFQSELNSWLMLLVF